MTEHIGETRDQAHRLEACLEACGGSTSMVKDALLSVMGLAQFSVQGFADDAVLKALVADTMTEHLEIATYRILLTLTDLAGKPDLRPRLEKAQHEEEAMADWFDQNLESITRRFVEIRAWGGQADAPPQDAAMLDGEELQMPGKPLTPKRPTSILVRRRRGRRQDAQHPQRDAGRGHVPPR